MDQKSNTVDIDKIRNIIVTRLREISQEDMFQIESIEALDELTLDHHDKAFIDDLNAVKTQLKDRSLKYSKLADYVESKGCDLSKFRVGLVKEFNSNGKTHMTSNWNYLGCLLIAVVESFLELGITSC